MKFIPLASSSHGNAYLVSDGRTRILLECGLAYRTLQKRLGFALCELDGVLVTHEHKDHARCACELVGNGQEVWMTGGTALALGLAEEKELAVEVGGTDSSTPLRSAQNDKVGEGMTVRAIVGAVGVHLVEHREQFRVGSFDFVAFRTYHDAAEPVGFLIRSRVDKEVLAFATDTVNLRYRFPGLRLLAIEANYDEEVLARSTRLPEKTVHRIRNTHMEIDTLCDILRGMDLRGCREIWLLHLSDSMSREMEFVRKVEAAVPRGVRVTACPR